MTTASAPTTTAVAKFDPAQPCTLQQLRGLFQSKRPDLEGCYRDGMKSAAARLSQAVVTEVMKSEKLQQCSGLSLLSCAVQAAQLNLEIGGPTGQAYMVPRAGQATFQVGYRGLITLAHRSRRVASICAVAVRTGDKFRVRQGTDRGIEHDPLAPPGKEVTHIYAVVQYRGGGMDFEVMTAEQINSHRDKFAADKRPNSVWGLHWEQMGLKTVLRRLLKRCPIGVDLGPDEAEYVDAGGEVHQVRETPRQIETNEAEAEVVDDAEVERPETPKTEGDPFKAAIVAEIERLAAQVGSWEDVRKEYAEALGFAGTRVKDLTPEQALKLRDQLVADAKARAA